VENHDFGLEFSNWTLTSKFNAWWIKQNKQELNNILTKKHYISRNWMIFKTTKGNIMCFCECYIWTLASMHTFILFKAWVADICSWTIGHFISIWHIWWKWIRTESFL
jgi:hypothetical protein